MDSTSPFRPLAYSAVLVALGVALGYALAWVPNVELVSFTAALAGYLLGASLGAFVGAMIFMLYSFLSPFGMAPLPLWLAQGIGGLAWGICGAVFTKYLARPVFAAGIAIAATLFYDIITNAAGYFAFPTGSTFIVYLVSGISFALVHIVSNCVLFALLFPLLTAKLGKKPIIRRGMGQ